MIIALQQKLELQEAFVNLILNNTNVLVHIFLYLAVKVVLVLLI